MKILFATDAFPCLSQTFVLDQITGLIDRGHQVKIVSFGSQEEVNQPEIEEYGLKDKTIVVPRPKSKLNKLSHFLSFVFRGIFINPGLVFRALKLSIKQKDGKIIFLANCFLKEPSFDIIQAHFGPIGLRALLLKDLKIGKKLITMFHGYGVRRAKEEKKKKGINIYKNLFKKGDLFLINCHYHLDILKKFGLKTSKSRIHYVGVDTNKFIPVKSKDDSLKTKLITVARLHPIKGIKYALKAIKKKKEQFKNLDYQIIGGGEQEKKLRELADQYKIEEIVSFSGGLPRDRVLKELKQADIFLLTSLKEGLPLAIVEAMACGLPVIASKVCGIPEVVEDGQTGLLIETKNPQQIAAAISRLIDDKELRRKMSQKARGFVREKFDIDKLNDKLERYYKELLAN